MIEEEDMMTSDNEKRAIMKIMENGMDSADIFLATKHKALREELIGLIKQFRQERQEMKKELEEMDKEQNRSISRINATLKTIESSPTIAESNAIRSATTDLLDSIIVKLDELSDTSLYLKDEIKKLKRHRIKKKKTKRSPAQKATARKNIKKAKAAKKRIKGILQQKVGNYCSKLQLSIEVQNYALNILKYAKIEKLYTPPTPKCWIAAAIYIASINCNESRTQSEVRAIVGFVNITRCSKLLYEKLDIKIEASKKRRVTPEARKSYAENLIKARAAKKKIYEAKKEQ